MSRSQRKVPMLSYTTCRSERQDKKIWHRRWRALERTALNSASIEELSAHLPLLEKQVSSIWDMGKDGRSYWSVESRIALAEGIAQCRSRKSKERESIKIRLLRKLMGK